ncbi:MAG: hypothetical protein Ct9H300mP1_11890 [Planctomycetaceae bacterium]|nr:MAG: hypothetical protein Ct9H300mP1_11890 [Planctomycetaceae bacterium]
MISNDLSRVSRPRTSGPCPALPALAQLQGDDGVSNHPRVVRIDDVVLGVLEDPPEAANLFDGTTLPQVGVRLQHLAGPASNPRGPVSARPSRTNSLAATTSDPGRCTSSPAPRWRGRPPPASHPARHGPTTPPRQPPTGKVPGSPAAFSRNCDSPIQRSTRSPDGPAAESSGATEAVGGSDPLDGTGQQDHRQQHNPQAPPPHQLPLLLAAAHCAAKPRPIAMPVGELARLSGSPPTDPVA